MSTVIFLISLITSYIQMDLLCLIAKVELPLWVEAMFLIFSLRMSPMGNFWGNYYDTHTDAHTKKKHTKTFVIFNVVQILLYVFIIRPYFVGV